jgi:hypothetical protein
LMFPASFGCSPLLWVFVVRSIPARSTKDIIWMAASLCSSQWFVRISLTVKMQWDRLELWFNLVAAKCKFSFPKSKTRTASSAERTQISLRPSKQ